MATPTAEVLISPEIALTAMQEMQRDFERAFKKIGDDAEKKIKKGVGDGIKDGVKKGRMSIGGALGKIGGGLGGLALGGGIAGLALMGISDTIGRADQGAAIIEGLLGQGEATTQIGIARSSGLSLAEFSRFSESLRLRGGFSDPQDIADVFKELNLRVEEQKNDGKGRLLQFSEFQGSDRISQILAAAGGLGSEQQLQLFDEAGLGEVAPRLVNYLAEISKGGTIQGADLLKTIQEDQKTEGERLAEQLREQAELEKTFREKQLEYQNEVREKMLDALDGEKINTLFEDRERQAKDQLKLVEDFNVNMKNANIAREGMQSAMDTLNEVTKAGFDAVMAIRDWLVGESEKERNKRVNELNAKTEVAVNEKGGQAQKTFETGSTLLGQNSGGGVNY